MLDAASARFPGTRFRAAAMDGQALGFADGTFDGVICQLRLPDHREQLHLSFALADAARVEGMLRAAGFSDVRAQREQRDAVYESFDRYWSPIEEGVGSMPQVYRALPEATRLAVRRDVKERLSRFETRDSWR